MENKRMTRENANNVKGSLCEGWNSDSRKWQKHGDAVPSFKTRWLVIGWQGMGQSTTPDF
jgi:hypothetical protein